jgi:single-strand DNA-binding protein
METKETKIVRINSIQINGNLGQTPELREFSNDKCIAKFSIAQHTFVNGEKFTHWYTIVLWNEKARTACEKLSKGDFATFHGRLSSREYQTPDGQKRVIYEIIASEFILEEGVQRKAS